MARIRRPSAEILWVVYSGAVVAFSFSYIFVVGELKITEMAALMLTIVLTIAFISWCGRAMNSTSSMVYKAWHLCSLFVWMGFGWLVG